MLTMIKKRRDHSCRCSYIKFDSRSGDHVITSSPMCMEVQHMDEFKMLENIGNVEFVGVVSNILYKVC